MTDHTDNSWYALAVKPQHEKRVAEMLRYKGFEEFLPLYKAFRVWGRKKRSVELPLIPHYVFCRFDLADRLPVVEIPSVRGIVKFQNRPAPVDADELEQIRVLSGLGHEIAPHPFLNQGCTVRVQDGPMAGVTGILTRFKQKHRLVVSVSLLGRAVAVEVDCDSVEVVRPGPVSVTAQMPPAKQVL